MAAVRSEVWLTRWVLLRGMMAIWLCAFLSAAMQVLPLLGADGVLPAGGWLARVDAAGKAAELPSLFWFDHSDAALSLAAWTGVALSLLGLVVGPNAPLAAALWLLYLSIVNVGQVFWGFGWELMLLESGFLTIWLAPALSPRLYRTGAAPPPSGIVWLYRWLVFRLMLGAGLIKLRGDECWRALTCLDTHFETQPLPNPLSPWFHRLPPWLHHGMVGWNHVIELLVPWFLLAPRPWRTVAALLTIQFQLTLLLSGNLSFFNALTIVVCLACVEDGAWRRVLPRGLVAAADAARAGAERAAREAGPTEWGEAPAGVWVRRGVVLLVAVLSVQPVLNMLSPDQRMNAAYDRWKLVNTYGAFGSVGAVRDELVVEGRRGDGPWLSYELPCKPGDTRRRPCVLSPLQRKLDWQIWFAAMQAPADHPWMLRWLIRLLRGDASARALLAVDPFPDTPPDQLRVEHYHYRFAPAGSDAWWEREYVGPWLPPLSLDDPRVQGLIERMGWEDLRGR